MGRDQRRKRQSGDEPDKKMEVHRREGARRRETALISIISQLNWLVQHSRPNLVVVVSLVISYIEQEQLI